MKIKVIMEMELILDRNDTSYKGLDFEEVVNQALGGVRYDIEKQCSQTYKKIKITQMNYQATQEGEIKL